MTCISPFSSSMMMIAIMFVFLAGTSLAHEQYQQSRSADGSSDGFFAIPQDGPFTNPSPRHSMRLASQDPDMYQQMTNQRLTDQELYLQQQQQRDEELSKSKDIAPSTTVCVEVRTNPRSPVTVCGPQIQPHSNPLVLVPSNSKDSIKIPQPVSFNQQPYIIDRRAYVLQQPPTTSIVSPQSMSALPLPSLLYQKQYLVNRPQAQDGQLSMNCRVGGNLVDTSNPPISYRIASLPLPMQYKLAILNDKNRQDAMLARTPSFNWNIEPTTPVWMGMPENSNVMMYNNQMRTSVMGPNNQQPSFQEKSTDSNNNFDRRMFYEDMPQQPHMFRNSDLSPNMNMNSGMPMMNMNNGMPMNMNSGLPSNQMPAYTIDTLRRLESSKKKLQELRAQLSAIEDERPGIRASQTEDKMTTGSMPTQTDSNKKMESTFPEPSQIKGQNMRPKS